MTRSLAEIDALLAADKGLFGAIEWSEEGSVASISTAVVDVLGDPIGGLELRASAPTQTSVQRGSIILILDGVPLQRLSHRPTHAHRNKGAHPIPPDLRFKTLPPDRTRIYGWSDNRVWPRQDNIGAGRTVDPQPSTFIHAMELFLEACGISAYIPEPPHRPELELDS